MDLLPPECPSDFFNLVDPACLCNDWMALVEADNLHVFLSASPATIRGPAVGEGICLSQDLKPGSKCSMLC